MRFILCAALALLIAAPALAEKRALTIEDLYSIRKVADPQFSPDGKRIAFYTVTYDLAAGTSNADIYVMLADGSAQKRMTSDAADDTHPRWSPDGRFLLFVSTRSGTAQAWRMPVGGGEATQLTHFAPGVNEPEWATDGSQVVFYSEVFPECGADSDCNEAVAKDMENGPARAHLADDLLYRHWTFWKDGKRFHVLRYDIESDTYTDVTPGELDFPYYTAGGHMGFAAAPDGEICSSSNADPDHWRTTNKDLFLFPAAGGEPVNITADNEGADTNPAYSPDGRYIAYLKQTVPVYESDLVRLAVYDRRKGAHEILTGEFDNWVIQFKWAPNSKSIYFLAAEKGARPLYKVDVKSKKISRIVDMRRIDSFDISPDGKLVAMARNSMGEPVEIWSCTAGGKKPARLTMFNRVVEEQVDLRPAEEMWIDSPTGQKIHTFLIKPHGFDPSKKYPLILNVHGGPQGQWQDRFRGDAQVYPAAGYVVAMANPHGSSGYGQEFTRGITRDWGGKVYQDLMAVTDAVAKLPFVDEERMGAMGWSYGGYMMMWMEGHTKRFRCLAAMMGLYNLEAFWGGTEEIWFPEYELGTPWESQEYDRWSPHRFAQNFSTPCLVVTGMRDFRVPYTQSLDFFTAVRKQGVPARLLVFEEDGHWPSWVKSMPLYYNAHLEWFHEHLGGAPAPWKTEEMVRNRAFAE